jgi:hypothetical protein
MGPPARMIDLILLETGRLTVRHQLAGGRDDIAEAIAPLVPTPGNILCAGIALVQLGAIAVEFDLVDPFVTGGCLGIGRLSWLSSAPNRRKLLMAEGKQVRVSKKGRKYLGWPEMDGKIVGESPDRSCWTVRFGGSKRPRSVHKSFVDVVDEET